MADIYWPAGVPDDPLGGDQLSWQPSENLQGAATGSAQARVMPLTSGIDIEMTAGFPMSKWQFEGLWLPWWLAKRVDGGCQGGTPFWLRCPVLRVPLVWTRKLDQPMRPEADGLGKIVWLSLVGQAT